MSRGSALALARSEARRMVPSPGWRKRERSWCSREGEVPGWADEDLAFDGVVADLAAGFQEGEIDAGEGLGVAVTPGDGFGGFEIGAGGDVTAGGEVLLALVPHAIEEGIGHDRNLPRRRKSTKLHEEYLINWPRMNTN